MPYGDIESPSPDLQLRVHGTASFNLDMFRGSRDDQEDTGDKDLEVGFPNTLPSCLVDDLEKVAGSRYEKLESRRGDICFLLHVVVT